VISGHEYVKKNEISFESIPPLPILKARFGTNVHEVKRQFPKALTAARRSWSRATQDGSER